MKFFNKKNSSKPVSVTRRNSAGRSLVAGSVLLLVSVAGAGFYAGWSYRDGRTEEQVRRVSDIVVDRPIVVTEQPEMEVSDMPNILGLPIVDARQVLSGAGIELSVVTEEPQPFGGESGIVLSQDPAPGTPPPSAVTLTLSQATAVPDMVGADLEVASQILEDLGVRVVAVPVYVAGATEGTVLSSSPVAGEPLSTELTVEVASEGSAVFLSDLKAVDSDCRYRDVSVNGTAWNDAIECAPRYEESKESDYLLNREIDTFSATIGISDRSEAGVSLRYEVFVDGTSVFETTLGYGQTAVVDVSTQGALRLTFRTTRVNAVEDCCNVSAVWANAKFHGSQEAVDRLIAESTT